MVTLKKLLKVFVRCIGSIAAIAMIAYVCALGVNWRDRAPSDAAVRLMSVYRDRPPTADFSNGYVFAMGFSADRNGDPERAGVMRVGWLRRLSEDPRTPLSDDPLGAPYDFRAPRTQQAQRLADACRTAGSECAVALEGADPLVADWLVSEQWLFDRYRALLSHAAWREPIPFDVRTPLPPYVMIFDGQKLLLSRAWLLAGHKDAAAVRELLSEDLRFWRQVLQSSDVLITKMIAVAALNRHFGLGTLVLRRLPAQLVADAMPPDWTQEITRSERSMMLCLAGEWIFIDRYIKQVGHRGPASANPLGDDAPGAVSSWLWYPYRPLYQAQDSSNSFAERLLQDSRELDAPYDRYAEALQRTKAISSRKFRPVDALDWVYNATGHAILWDDFLDYGPYGARVADLEGTRRGAVLTAELRAHGFTAAQVPAQLAASGVVVPYTGRPFSWDPQEGAIVFTGLEPGERGRHVFKY